MNAQQLFQIEQRSQHNRMLLHHFPNATFMNCTKEYAALLQANNDLRILIHEVKMSRKSFRVEIDEELHAKLKIKAAVTGIPVAAYCRKALTKWVDKEKPIILPPTTDQPNLSAEALADIYSDITVTEAAEDQPNLSTSAQADKK